MICHQPVSFQHVLLVLQKALLGRLKYWKTIELARHRSPGFFFDFLNPIAACISTMKLSLSSVPWSIRPLTTHDVFIFKVRFLAASHMVLGDVSPVFSITWLRKRSLCPPLAFFPWTLPARMRSSSSPFRMMWPVKRVCLSLMVLRSWRSCPIRWSTEMLVSCAVYETRSIRR